MKNKKCIIKRKGHEEVYDEKKVYASVYAAALNCEYGEEKSERIAKKIMGKISALVKKGKCTSSEDIRNKVIELLDDKDVSLMYKRHLDLS